MVSYDVSMIIHAVSRVDITMVSVDLPRVGARSQGLAAKSGKQTLRRWKFIGNGRNSKTASVADG